ncbi:flagellar hook-basal body complex protein [Rhizobiales bacterium]|uniref:flagellar hook protein FlgE n=1 Tax=Hongsoonwoonella zoysiae TaxID=2821844 RepID=UPI0015613203|nr:flagellar hook-basal body complex protein [Hongsoonwoonella zoysiae]NRG18000.1 flagellar hook-basal body complex protein [Hongsoonwoonella zoysiae]
MGVFGALNAAVSGLTAQSFALENISGNIANSSTYGFKRLDTSFSDFVGGAAGSATSQRSGTVTAQSRTTNHIAGDPLQFNDEDTYISIDGPGYFVVAERVGDSDGQPVFGGNNLYTRRGDFEFDNAGRLVNKAGYYLQGRPIDPETGNISAGVPEIIQVDNTLIPAVATSRVTLTGNLPKTPDVSQTPLTFFEPADGAASDNPAITAGTALGKQSITLGEQTQFLESTVGGGVITGYTTIGEPVNVQYRWAKTQDSGFASTIYGSGSTDLTGTPGPDLSAFDATDSVTLTADNGDTVTYTFDGTATQAVALETQLNNAGFTVARTSTGLNISRSDGQRFTVEGSDAAVASLIGFTGAVPATPAATPAVEDTWALYYNTNSDPQAAGEQIWAKAGDFQFDANGNLTYPSNAQHTISNLTVDGTNLGDITLDFSTGLTQFDTDDVATRFSQNGFPAGEVVNTAINDSGRLVATYSNGRQRDLYEITVVTFQGENSLSRGDGGVFEETAESGPPVFGNGGSILGQTVEGSNVEIADEFSKLIVTQQAYSANTRIITTADELLQETINIVR